MPRAALVLVGTVAPVAFNLADVFVLAGFLLVAGTTIALAVGHREQLREPLRLR